MFDSEYKTQTQPFYLVINLLFGHIEKIEGSSDRYLVVNINKKIMFLTKYGDLLNKELHLMKYGNLLKMKLFLIMRIIK